jgi:site-specific DNA recombinase
MRAVIYARYSSELQRDASIEDQVRSCKSKIDAEGWTLAMTYTDYAQSGSSHRRPGFQRLLTDGRSGAFDVVVAEALDRLSRDQEHVAAFYKQLSFAGVKIVTLAEGDVSELHIGLKGTMNALFLKDLAQKTHRGLKGRVHQGRSAGGRVYGYDIVRESRRSRRSDARRSCYQ